MRNYDILDGLHSLPSTSDAVVQIRPYDMVTFDVDGAARPSCWLEKHGSTFVAHTLTVPGGSHEQFSGASEADVLDQVRARLRERGAISAEIRYAGKRVRVRKAPDGYYLTADKLEEPGVRLSVDVPREWRGKQAGELRAAAYESFESYRHLVYALVSFGDWSQVPNDVSGM